MLGAAVVLTALLPACGGECTTEAFAVVPVGHVGAPATGPAANAAAACPVLVAYNGIDYDPRPISGAWIAIGADSVEEIGTASGSNTPVDDRRVYGLEGVPPEVAIAMRLNDGAGLTILTPYESSFNPLLCPYLADPQSGCGGTRDATPTKAP